MACVLCRGDHAEGGLIPQKDAYEIDCWTCGKYRVTGRAHAMLGGEGFDPEKRLRLTWAARQASELDAPLELAPENLDQIAESVVEPHPPSRKLDSLVLLLGNRTQVFGGSVEMGGKPGPSSSLGTNRNSRHSWRRWLARRVTPKEEQTSAYA